MNELDGATARAMSIDGAMPRYIAAPRSGNEVAEILREASDRRLTIGPRGGGTKIEIGNPPRSLDVVLSLRNVNGIIDYTPADMTITVRSGAPLSEIQTELARHNQMLALDPPYGDEATIGGILAVNDSGPRRYGYGTARDVVIGTTVACLDGRLAKAGGKVVKNVTGYDLNKLYVGSLGTLAVLVEASFKLHPRPLSPRTIWADFADPRCALNVTKRLARSPLNPVAMALTDRPDPAVTALPALWYRLLVEFTGSTAALARKVRETLQYCGEAGARDAGECDSEQDVWAPIREHPRTFGTPGGMCLKAAVPAPALADLLEAARALSGDRGILGRELAFAGDGIALLYFDKAESGDHAALTQDLRSRAVALGGSLVVRHAPTAVKKLVDVWGAIPSGLGVMKSLKAAYDPLGLLNPGRFVGGI